MAERLQKGTAHNSVMAFDTSIKERSVAGHAAAALGHYDPEDRLIQENRAKLICAMGRSLTGQSLVMRVVHALEKAEKDSE